MIVYKATNLINNKIYIGQTTKNLEQRIKKHWSDTLREQQNKRTSVRFHNALYKYGKQNFYWEIIDKANNLEELNKKEIYWIKKLNANEREYGYNETSGGESGYKTQEVKDKISLKKKKNWENPDLAKRMKEGLEKATKTWVDLCKERRIEKICECCHKSFSVPPYEVSQRKYCSNECANKVNIRKATSKAIEVKKENTKEKYNSFSKEVLNWADKEKDLILSCPFNKVSSTLKEIKNIAIKYGFSDWRIICKALCGSSSKKIMLKYLQENVKRYAELT